MVKVVTVIEFKSIKEMLDYYNSPLKDFPKHIIDYLESCYGKTYISRDFLTHLEERIVKVKFTKVVEDFMNAKYTYFKKDYRKELIENFDKEIFRISRLLKSSYDYNILMRDGDDVYILKNLGNDTIIDRIKASR